MTQNRASAPAQPLVTSLVGTYDVADVGDLRARLFRDTQREWRFSIVAGNGEAIAQSEGYQRLSDAEAAALLIVGERAHLENEEVANGRR